MNLRMRVMIIGGVLGALVGVSAAYLYLRSAALSLDEGGRERLPAIQPSRALTSGLSVLTMLKSIVGLGQPS